MDIDSIRRTAIQAMFADEVLMERLTLKGGNALRLVYGIGTRASIDIDLSMEDDFEAIDEIRERVVRVLEDRFDSAKYAAFDIRIDRRPPGSLPGDLWGGYDIEFKVISQERYKQLGGNLGQIRRQADVVGEATARRRFKIQISTHEYCRGRALATLDDYIIPVYTPEMIAIEKLRAICQQMPGYREGRAHPTARARDFYDIYQVVTEADIKLDSWENLELLRNIFATKNVPPELLRKIPETRKFHRVDWQAVVDTVYGELKDYDFYFDAVVKEVRKLEALWVE